MITGKHILLVGLAGLLALGGSLAWEFVQFRDNPINASGQLFEVKPGAPVRHIAAELVEGGHIEREVWFTLLARLNNVSTRIKAGEYRLDADLTPETLLDRMVRGEVVDYGVTFVEGWTFAQMRDVLEQHPAIRQTLNGEDKKQIMEKLGRPDQSPEGLFLPETYRFPRNTSDLDILKRAMRDMDSVLQKAWDGRARNLPYKDPYEVLIMASIVEKETGQASERPQIAGVFVRRLQRGMKLQTDPTVIYGMGERFDGNIRRSDLRRDTPWNTYTRHGLPPTPIAMPGKAAILASVLPAPGNTLYFVSRGDGSHYFSKNLQEHNAAVRKYQLRK